MGRKQQGELTIREHLEELRKRLFWAALAVLAGTVAAFAFHQQILGILSRPAGNTQLIFTEVTEMLGVSVKVSLLGGLILSLPVVAYQLLMFASPGLTPRERRYLYLSLPAIVFAFAGGVAFGYFVVIPPAIRFLIAFNADVAQPMIRIGNYISLMTSLLFWIGLTFETPVVMFVLAKLRIVSYRTFARWRRLAFLLAFLLAAIITPTFDPINQSLVAIPIILLYEAGIWLARLAQWGRQPQARKTTQAPEAGS